MRCVEPTTLGLFGSWHVVFELDIERGVHTHLYGVTSARWCRNNSTGTADLDPHLLAEAGQTRHVVRCSVMSPSVVPWGGHRGESDREG